MQIGTLNHALKPINEKKSLVHNLKCSIHIFMMKLVLKAPTFKKKMRSLFLFLLFSTVYTSCHITKSPINEDVGSKVKSVKIIPAVVTVPDQIVIAGHVTLDEGESMLFGSVGLYNEEELVSGTQSDFDGNYSLTVAQAEDSVSYTIEFSYVGYQTMILTDLILTKGDSCYITTMLEEEGVLLFAPVCRSYTIPVYQQDNLTSGQTFDSDQIGRSSTRGR